MVERICRVFAAFTASAGIFFFMYSCASLPKQAETEESLRNTASLYWTMKMEGKSDEALQMEEQERLIAENKSGMPLSEYYRGRAGAVMQRRPFEIKKVSIQDGKGRVDMEFTQTFPEIPKPMRQPYTDEWIFKDGKWLHLFR
jgi:hypothetical protein